MAYSALSRTTAILSLILICSFSCSEQTAPKVVENQAGWTNLIDKDLSKWDTYLSFKHQNGYDGSAPTDEAGDKIEPVGLNKPGYNVFTTFEEDNETVIKVTGEYYGCLASKDIFENYHLQVKYKWGDKKWIPRMDKMKDSGILYHSSGEFGVEHWRSWMMSQEFQIMEAHSGDFWSQATSAIDIRAYRSESGINPMAQAGQDFQSFGENGDAGKYCTRSNNYESPLDEWTTLDLISYNGKSLHIVNGEVVMILKNSRYIDENDNAVPMTKGKIQLQSEAAELFFKGIKIRPIDKLPAEYASLYE